MTEGLQNEIAGNAGLLSSLQETQRAIGYISGGLTSDEARSRLVRYGFNEIADEKPPTIIQRLWINIKNPLIILLAVVGGISFATGDIRSGVVVFVMVILGIVLRYIQEKRADSASAKLKAMVSTHATVCRDGKDMELPLKYIVPGDTIRLGSGDMVPADIWLLSSKDLYLNQSALTGESMPVEKTADSSMSVDVHSPEAPNICFMGSNVESGSATAMVIRTGDQTSFGDLAAKIVNQQEVSSFDKGINKFTWLMIRFILIMVPLVFLINGLSKHSWLEAFLFALAVAVGLTPEMLPMIVTVNLSKGAISMSKKKVIVKRLNAIQNFGAMDVLCTDKTGTLTQGKIILELHLDPSGLPSRKVLHFGYLNSYHQTGLKNLMDKAILDHEELEEGLKIKDNYKKIDEIPFDFSRKRMSVVLEDEKGLNILICKGAAESVMSLCTTVEVNGIAEGLSEENYARSLSKVTSLNMEGFRVVAIGYKIMEGATDEPTYSVKDEQNLVLLGFLCFLDPPKESTLAALERLTALNVEVKILTGDNEIVTAYICKKVGVSIEQGILTGAEVQKMDDTTLSAAVNHYAVFARLIPVHKQRIIQALMRNGHVTGFMGDGINDAPALKVADVGISVDSAVDIAKESSDIILLENSLLILEQGVVEGRKVFGNIIKYIKMAASSSFGNMFSVVGASIFLPFLPMLPIQVLTNNLLYDLSQTTIPTDNVDADWLKKPRKWAIGEIEKFILVMGPVSSIFDYLTFFVLMYFFDAKNNAPLFHTGWFIESLFTQTLIIHVIRTNRIPFIESRASRPLIINSLLILVLGSWLTISPLAHILGLVSLPGVFWIWLTFIVIGYMLMAQYVKNWFNKKYATH